jgi:N-acetylmuramoyl-L-alanine amidase
MYKWLSGLFLFCLVPLLLGSGYYHQGKAKKQWIIVIDPGHGGKDPGCQGKKWKEKNVALAVSLKFGHYIEDNDKDVKVVYTRKTDEFVGLNERAELANKDHADLFICIHCNASPNHDAYGAATYVMGLRKSEGNLEVEKRENSSILYEKDYKTTYGGFDPNSPEANILFAMYQNVFLNQSLDLASKIQSEYAHYLKRKDNEVKQAGFLVLWKTAMPSLLTEIGFLTNPEEEKFLGSQKGQDEIAKALFLAFQQYKAEKDGSDYDPKSFDFKPLIVQDPDSATVLDTTKTTHDTITTNNKIPVIKDTITLKKDTVKTTTQHAKKDSAKKHNVKTDHKAVKDSTDKKINNMKNAVKGMQHDSGKIIVDTVVPFKRNNDTIIVHKKVDTTAIHKRRMDSLAMHKKRMDSLVTANRKRKTDSIAANKKRTDSIANAIHKRKLDSIVIHKKQIDSIASLKRKRKADSIAVVKRIADSIAHQKKETVEDTGKIIYKVQFLLSDHELQKDDKRFDGLNDVGFYIDNKNYKYTSGHFENLEDAIALQKKMQGSGFKDAFVVAFKGSKRVPVKKPATK